MVCYFTWNRVSIKYFVNVCLWKHFFPFNLSQTTANLIFSKVLVTPRLFALFHSKVRAIKHQKSAKICLTLKLLFRSFQWGWNLLSKDFFKVLRSFTWKLELVSNILLMLVVSNILLMSVSENIFFLFNLSQTTSNLNSCNVLVTARTSALI